MAASHQERVGTDKTQGASKHNIMLAVDKSQTSERVCQWAADHLLHPGDEVHFIHVEPMAEIQKAMSDRAPWPPAGAGEDEEPDAKRMHTQKTMAYIEEKFVPKLNGAPYQVEILFRKADAESVGELLCQRARELHAIALVMGSHHKTPVKRFFSGSSSIFAVKHCEQPVVVVP